MADKKVLQKKNKKRLERRKKHIRKKCFGTAEKPRLVVFRSNKHIYAQVVDDMKQVTITGCSTLTPALKDKLSAALKKTEEAKIVGEHIGAISIEKGITVVTFDRNGRRYHGRIKALAESARAAGLEF